MALDNTDLVLLKAELDLDPAFVGYAGNTNRDIAALLNQRGAGDPPVTLERQFVTAAELQQACDGPNLASVMSGNANTWRNLMWLAILMVAASGEGIPLGNDNLRAQVLEIWPAGQTLTNLIALQTRPASRMESLFGENATASELDVNRAKELPS